METKATMDTVVRRLVYLLRTYDGLNKLIVSCKNRLKALNPEAMPEFQDEIKAMESLRGTTSRQIGRELKFFPLWTEYMQHIDGIGPYIGGNLIILYYYRFVAICSDCGADLAKKDDKNGRKTLTCTACDKPAKREGLLNHRIEVKDFANISKWWAYVGQHNVDGKMPKMAKGSAINWSPRGRAISYQIGEQFEKRGGDHLYRQFYNERKARHVKKNPDTTPNHRRMMARREAAKLFLAHFWTVARTIDGKPLTAPYAGAIMGHTNLIAPFYWPAGDSQDVVETQTFHASRKKNVSRNGATAQR